MPPPASLDTTKISFASAMFANACAIIGALVLFYRPRVVNPLAGLNRNLRDLLDGKAGVSIGYQEENSEIGEVARSLEKYRRAAQEVETQRLIKGHIAEISQQLQKVDTAQQFAEKLLGQLLPMVEGGCGAFYLLEPATGRYRFAG